MNQKGWKIMDKKFKHLYADGLETIVKENNFYDVTVNANFKLYKYCSLKEYDIDNLLKGRIYLGTALNFNDSFDSVPYYSRDLLDEYLNKIFEKVKKEQDLSDIELSDLMNDKALKLKIIHSIETTNRLTALISCFSSTPKSNIMWGHYADMYSGAVFEYNYMDILNDAKDLMQDVKSRSEIKIPDKYLDRSIILDPVRYVSERMDMTDIYKKGLDLYNLHGDSIDFNNPNTDIIVEDDVQYKKQMIDMYYCKLDDWEYEREWRLLIPNFYLDGRNFDTTERHSAFLLVKPSKVIIGYKASERVLREVINICHYNDIPMYGAGPDYNSKVDSVSVEPLKSEFIEHFLLKKLEKDE